MLRSLQLLRSLQHGRREEDDGGVPFRERRRARRSFGDHRHGQPDRRGHAPIHPLRPPGERSLRARRGREALLPRRRCDHRRRRAGLEVHGLQPPHADVDVDDVRRLRGGHGQLPRQRGGEARRARRGDRRPRQLRLDGRVQLGLRRPLGDVDPQVQEPHPPRRPPRGRLPRAGADDSQQRRAAASPKAGQAYPLSGRRRLERGGRALPPRTDGERDRHSEIPSGHGGAWRGVPRSPARPARRPALAGTRRLRADAAEVGGHARPRDEARVLLVRQVEAPRLAQPLLPVRDPERVRLPHPHARDVRGALRPPSPEGQARARRRRAEGVRPADVLVPPRDRGASPRAAGLRRLHEPALPAG